MVDPDPVGFGIIVPDPDPAINGRAIPDRQHWFKTGSWCFKDWLIFPDFLKPYFVNVGPVFCVWNACY